MVETARRSHFQTQVLCAAEPDKAGASAFLVLPKDISGTLPRRGRTTVEGTINGYPFRATLEPDGQLSHWLRVSEELREESGVQLNETVEIEVAPVKREPDPSVPIDLEKALSASPEAKAMWDATTTLARLDWIHWLDSAKQSKTRRKRILDACDMLSSGKRRVCCFDQSGFYSKGLSAPLIAEASDVIPAAT